MERIATQSTEDMAGSAQSKAWILRICSAEMPAWLFFLDFLVYPQLILLCILQENFQSLESVLDIRQSVKLLAAEYPMQKS